MSVQRKPQNRDALVKGVNPRTRKRDEVAAQLATRAELEQQLGVTFGNHPLDTRQGLITVGLLRPGVAFTTLPRERERMRANQS